MISVFRFTDNAQRNLSRYVKVIKYGDCYDITENNLSWYLEYLEGKSTWNYIKHINQTEKYVTYFFSNIVKLFLGFSLSHTYNWAQKQI